MRRKKIYRRIQQNTPSSVRYLVSLWWRIHRFALTSARYIIVSGGTGIDTWNIFQNTTNKVRYALVYTTHNFELSPFAPGSVVYVVSTTRVPTCCKGGCSLEYFSTILINATPSVNIFTAQVCNTGKRYGMDQWGADDKWFLKIESSVEDYGVEEACVWDRHRQRVLFICSDIVAFFHSHFNTSGTYFASSSNSSSWYFGKLLMAMKSQRVGVFP